MNKVNLPNELSSALAALGTPQYGAYITGAYIRDILLGVEPKFAHIETGLVAQPQAVTADGLSVSAGISLAEFGSVEEYLKRTALFTCDALACGADGVLIDPLGAAQDIAARRLSLVEKPDDPALALIEAMSYCARFGFVPDDGVKQLQETAVRRLSRRGIDGVFEAFSEIILCDKAADAINNFFPTLCALVPEFSTLSDETPLSPVARALNSLERCAGMPLSVKTAVLLRPLCARDCSAAQSALGSLEYPDVVAEETMFLLDNRFAAIGGSENLDEQYGVQRAELLRKFTAAISSGFHSHRPRNRMQTEK